MSVGLLNGVAGFQAAAERLQSSALNIANATRAVSVQPSDVESEARPQVVQPVAQSDDGVALTPADTTQNEPAFTLDISTNVPNVPNNDGDTVQTALETAGVGGVQTASFGDALEVGSIVADAPDIGQGQGLAGQGLGVDITQDVVDQIVASNAAVANLNSIAVQDELLEETIDAFSNNRGSRVDVFA